MPRVSVYIASYNHEDFVVEAVNSALLQGYADLEVVVTDDGSSDRSVERLRAIKDARLKLIAFPQNRGIGAAVQRCVCECRGEFLAPLGSDDMLLPGRIARQVEYLDQHPEIGVVLGWPRFIDESGQPVPAPPAYQSLFSHENREPEEWSRHFFRHGNCLCIPTAMIRRSVIEDVGTEKVTLHHLGDYDFWIRVCQRHRIYILPEELTAYRILSRQGNLSAPSPAKYASAAFEHSHILRRFATPEGIRHLTGRDGVGPLDRLALAEAALEVGGPAHRLFALELIVETELDPANEAETVAFLEKARPILHNSDIFAKLTLSNLRQKRQEMRTKVSRLRTKLRELESSMSWRMTRPFRKFAKGLRKLLPVSRQSGQ